MRRGCCNCPSMQHALGKASIVFSALSCTCTLLAWIVPWLSVAEYVVVAGATVFVWPAGAVACGATVYAGGGCISASIEDAIVDFAPILNHTVLSAASMLANACTYALVALVFSLVLNVLAIVFTTRVYRGLQGVENECCMCMCCDGCFRARESGGRIISRIVAFAAHVLIAIFQLSAAANFGSSVSPIEQAIGDIEIRYICAGQAFAYLAGIFALLAAATDGFALLTTSETCAIVTNAQQDDNTRLNGHSSPLLPVATRSNSNRLIKTNIQPQIWTAQADADPMEIFAKDTTAPWTCQACTVINDGEHATRNICFVCSTRRSKTLTY